MTISLKMFPIPIIGKRCPLLCVLVVFCVDCPLSAPPLPGSCSTCLCPACALRGWLHGLPCSQASIGFHPSKALAGEQRAGEKVAWISTPPALLSFPPGKRWYYMWLYFTPTCRAAVQHVKTHPLGKKTTHFWSFLEWKIASTSSKTIKSTYSSLISLQAN